MWQCLCFTCRERTWVWVGHLSICLLSFHLVFFFCPPPLFNLIWNYFQYCILFILLTSLCFIFRNCDLIGLACGKRWVLVEHAPWQRWGGQRTTFRSSFSPSALLGSLTCIWRRADSRLGWSTSFWRSSSLLPSPSGSAGVTDASLCIFYMDSKDQTQVIRLVRSALCWMRHLTSPYRFLFEGCCSGLWQHLQFIRFCFELLLTSHKNSITMEDLICFIITICVLQILKCFVNIIALENNCLLE